MSSVLKALKAAHRYINGCVTAGEQVVDATAGNGNDTVFLARLVGVEGRVFAFDLQPMAISKTREKLKEAGLLQRVDLIHSGHEELDKYVKGEIGAAMFNLGYLPGGDHEIITRPQSTIQALQSCLHRLKVNGLITVVIYTGHEGGEQEKEALLKYCASLDQHQYLVLHYEIINQVNKPPSLLLLERIA